MHGKAHNYKKAVVEPGRRKRHGRRALPLPFWALAGGVSANAILLTEKLSRHPENFSVFILVFSRWRGDC